MGSPLVSGGHMGSPLISGGHMGSPLDSGGHMDSPLVSGGSMGSSVFWRVHGLISGFWRAHGFTSGFWRVHGFTSGFWRVHVAHLFSCLCCLLFCWSSLTFIYVIKFVETYEMNVVFSPGTCTLNHNTEYHCITSLKLQKQ